MQFNSFAFWSLCCLLFSLVIFFVNLWMPTKYVRFWNSHFVRVAIPISFGFAVASSLIGLAGYWERSLDASKNEELATYRQQIMNRDERVLEALMKMQTTNLAFYIQQGRDFAPLGAGSIPSDSVVLEDLTNGHFYSFEADGETVTEYSRSFERLGNNHAKKLRGLLAAF